MPFRSDHSFRTIQSIGLDNNWTTMTTRKNDDVPEIVSKNLNGNVLNAQHKMQSTLVIPLPPDMPLPALPHEALPMVPVPPTLPFKIVPNSLASAVTTDLLKTVKLTPPGDKPRKIKRPLGMKIVKKEIEDSVQPLLPPIPTMLLPKLVMDIHEDSNGSDGTYTKIDLLDAPTSYRPPSEIECDVELCQNEL